jgi:hypothetical protein
MHGLSLAHVSDTPPVQTPSWHESPVVQALPSLHDVPFGLLGLEQRPVAGSQTPASWQSSRAPQTTGFPPTQTPPWQASFRVQALPSSQANPFGRLAS